MACGSQRDAVGKLVELGVAEGLPAVTDRDPVRVLIGGVLDQGGHGTELPVVHRPPGKAQGRPGRRA